MRNTLWPFRLSLPVQTGNINHTTKIPYLTVQETKPGRGELPQLFLAAQLRAFRATFAAHAPFRDHLRTAALEGWRMKAQIHQGSLLRSCSWIMAIGGGKGI